MNGDALKDAHKLFADTGYNGSTEDFKTLISNNKDALNDAFTLFTETGYNGSIDDFSTLIGISESAKGKTETTEELVAETVPLDKKEKEVKSKFALDEREIDSIFDLLEEEHPDL